MCRCFICRKFDFMEMTGIPLDENDLKAKYADEFATAIILTINALKKDTRIESKRPKPKAKAAYIINRKPSVGTVVSTFKEKPMTKLPSRDAGTGGAEDFGRSVNPIPTRGADYAPHITTRPSKFSDLPTSLPSIATLAGTNKIVHNAFSRRRNQKYQELEIK